MGTRGWHAYLGLLWPLVHAKRCRPQIVVHRDWRGGQVWTVSGEDVTIRLHLEQHIVGERVVPLALFDGTDAAPVVGAPVVVRVSGSGADDYEIVEIRGAVFHGLMGPGTDQAGAVARGEFFPGAIGEAQGWQPYYED